MSKVPTIGGKHIGDNVYVMGIDRLMNAAGISKEQQEALYETCCVCGDDR